MLGVNDFIGYYDWTFHFLKENFGEKTLQEYWEEAVAGDALREFREKVKGGGVKPLVEHWVESSLGEGCIFQIVFGPDYFRYDMERCPSLSFLLEKGKNFFRDYCSHCWGWVKPLLDKGGWMLWHEHDHTGKCWWEMRKKGKLSEPGELAGKKDIRLREGWGRGVIHRFKHVPAPGKNLRKEPNG